MWVGMPVRLAAYSVSKAGDPRQPSRNVHVNLKLGIEDERSRNERDACASPFLASGPRDDREEQVWRRITGNQPGGNANVANKGR